MQALAVAGLSVALVLAGPSLWRFAADTGQLLAVENAAPAPAVSPPAQTEIAPTEKPEVVAATPPVSEATTIEPGAPVKDAIVAPVRRSQPKTPPIAQDKTTATDKAEPNAKSSGTDGKPGKSATSKKPVKKARLTRAEQRPKKQ